MCVSTVQSWSANTAAGQRMVISSSVILSVIVTSAVMARATAVRRTVLLQQKLHNNE